jgi:hypothetical protein
LFFCKCFDYIWKKYHTLEKEYHPRLRLEGDILFPEWVVWIVPFIVYCVMIKKNIYYLKINRLWEIKYDLFAYVIVVLVKGTDGESPQFVW